MCKVLALFRWDCQQIKISLWFVKVSVVSILIKRVMLWWALGHRRICNVTNKTSQNVCINDDAFVIIMWFSPVTCIQECIHFSAQMVSFTYIEWYCSLPFHRFLSVIHRYFLMIFCVFMIVPNKRISSLWCSTDETCTWMMICSGGNWVYCYMLALACLFSQVCTLNRSSLLIYFTLQYLPCWYLAHQ